MHLPEGALYFGGAAAVAGILIARRSSRTLATVRAFGVLVALMTAGGVGEFAVTGCVFEAAVFVAGAGLVASGIAALVALALCRVLLALDPERERGLASSRCAGGRSPLWTTSSRRRPSFC